MAQDDTALLKEYADRGSPAAFAQVVARYADAVFATALRQTRSRELAEDVTQAAFIVLARRAGNLRRDASVAAFLHQTTLYAAKNALRAQAARRRHERQAAANVATATTQGTEVADEPAVAVDRALHRLRDTDRDLLMLHYFEGLTMTEAAAKLRISHEAARKRLHRALDRLRTQLQREGVTVAAVAIPAAIQALAHPAATTSPTAIASTAVAGGTGGQAFTLALEVARTLKLLALQRAAAIVAVVLLVTATATVAVTQVLRPPPRALTQAPVAAVAPPPLPPAAARDDIIDYGHVFNVAQRTKDERQLLEQELRKVERDPGLRAQYERRQKTMMIEIMQAIEKAIIAVAAEEKVQVSLQGLPPYPKNLDAVTMNQLRPLLTARFIPRPAGAPDLTEQVLARINRDYAAQKPPRTMPSAAWRAAAERAATQRAATRAATQAATRGAILSTQPVRP